MKRMILTILAAAILIAGTAACVDNNPLVTVTVTLRNSTEHELETLIFQIPPTRGSYSPMYYLISPDGEYGRDPVSLKPGEERAFEIGIPKRDLGNQGWAVIRISGDDEDYTSDFIRVHAGSDNRFNITADHEMHFILNVIGHADINQGSAATYEGEINW